MTERGGGDVWERLGWFLVVVVVAGATGLYWAGQREDRTVDALADIRVDATVTPNGALEVTEELVVSAVDGPTVTRVLVAPDGVVWGGAFDSTGLQAPHMTVPIVEGLAVTIPVDSTTEVLTLDYTLQGVATAGRDAVELDWPVADDRNSLAIEGLRIDLGWSGGEPAAIIDIEAPGAAPTIVPGPADVRIEVGELPAHHEVEVHAALHLSAVPDGTAEDRSVMEEMVSGSVPTAEGAGGGPAWLPVVVAIAFASVWTTVHRTSRPRLDGRSEDVESAPSSHSPAEVGWLKRRGLTTDDDIAATLVDLLARHVLVLDPSGRWQRARSTAALEPHEVVVVEWLFADADVVDTETVVERIARDPATWRRTRRAFLDAVEGQERLTALVPRRVGDEAILGAGVAGASMVVGGVIGIALGQPWWLVTVLVGAAAMVSSDTLATLSPEGAGLVGRWSAFGERLAADGAVAAAHPGHVIVLEVTPTTPDPKVEAARTLTRLSREAFVTATSFVAGPQKRIRPRRHPASR